MREICIVPTFNRQELLYCCLEAIREAEPTMPLHVFADRGTDEREIAEQFGAIAHQTLQHAYHGNTYNMMEALKFCYQNMYEKVYIVEDDAIIEKDFFQWCRTAFHHWPEAFATCGWQYSPDAPKGDGPDLLIPWYLSVATCLPRRSLYPIVQHSRIEYYNDMKGYLDRAYPQSWRKGSLHYEQDGLAQRVMENESRRCVWPRRPRAAHIGFFGYHAGENRLAGPLLERVAIVKLAMKHPEVLAKMMRGGALPDTGQCRECGRVLLRDGVGEMVCVSCYHSGRPNDPVTAGSHYYLATSN